MPIFDSDHRKIDTIKESDVIFNYFDYQSHELLSSSDNYVMFGTRGCNNFVVKYIYNKYKRTI